MAADTDSLSPDEIPLFPLNTVLFPDGPLSLRIFEPRYLDMVRRCLRETRGFGVVLIREGGEVGPAEFESVGTLARIVDFNTLPGGLLGLTTVGERRLRVRENRRLRDGLNVGAVEWLESERTYSLPPEYAHLPGILDSLLREVDGLYSSLERRPDDATWVGYRLAELLPLTLPSRQFCLELEDPLRRLQLLSALVKPASPPTAVS